MAANTECICYGQSNRVYCILLSHGHACILVPRHLHIKTLVCRYRKERDGRLVILYKYEYVIGIVMIVLPQEYVTIKTSKTMNPQVRVSFVFCHEFISPPPNITVSAFSLYANLISDMHWSVVQ